MTGIGNQSISVSARAVNSYDKDITLYIEFSMSALTTRNKSTVFLQWRGSVHSVRFRQLGIALRNQVEIGQYGAYRNVLGHRPNAA